MFRKSFRSLYRRFVPWADPCKLALLAAAVLVAGCGGAHVPPQGLTGKGYAFSAPGDWTVMRTARSIQAAHGLEVVSVSRFPLLRPYRAALWPKVVPEIDRIAGGIASDQHGSVGARTTVTIAGGRARRYDIEYERGGRKLVERLGFVLHAKTEYELLCRLERGKSASACDLLFRSFRLT
jgi:hypothetical protein